MIEYDKLLHLLVGLIIAIFGQFVVSAEIALMIAFLAGIGKEIWDHFNPPHYWDTIDIVYTWAGAVLGYLFVIWHT